MFLNGEPLHVGWLILAAQMQRLYVVDLEARAGARSQPG